MNEVTARRRIGHADVACSAGLRNAVDGRSVVRRLAILAARSADSWCVLATLLVLWRLGDAPLRQRVATLAAAVIGTAVLVRLLKRVVRRDRPDAEWGGSYRRTDPHSFPSGHAARVGVIAAFTAAAFPPSTTLAVALWASAVAISRVALGVHYVSDVLAGLAVGITIGVLAGIV